MIVYPAIDLRKGRVVRLLQGRADAETVYFTDPSVPAKEWKAAGSEWVHVVDLDGAFAGAAENRDAVKSIIAAGMKVQLGGGMRSVEAVASALAAGVTRVVIGTSAAENPDFVGELVQRFGSAAIAVGIDARDGKVAIKGWVDVLPLDALELAKEVEQQGASTIIYTDISRDGMLTGPNFEAQEIMLRTVKCGVIASGGVARMSDMDQFWVLSKTYQNLDGVITGKALYEGTIDLVETLKGPVSI